MIEMRGSQEDLDINGKTVLQQDRQCRHKRNIEARSRNHCCRGKAIILLILRVCLQLQLSSMQGECALLYFLWLVLLYHTFPNYKRHDFRENVIERKMCVLVFSTTAFLKLFSCGGYFHQSECSTDHPTLGIIKLIRPAINSVLNMFLQQKIPPLLLRVEQVGQ